MALTETGKHKAATLLMGLDTVTASEFLKGLPVEAVQQLVMEMSQIDASGLRNTKEQVKIVREFQSSLGKNSSSGLNLESFLNSLDKILGEKKAGEIREKVRNIARKEDFFAPMHAATTDELVLALKEEHPQTVAVVLSELSPKRVQEILPLLGEDIARKIIWKMAKPTQLGTGVKKRMACVVSEKIKSFKGEMLTRKPEETLRDLAIVLSDVEKDLRSKLLDEISEQDEQTATMVRNLMVTWDDILTIADRSLQEALRTVEAKTLALALYQADETIVQKIRSNISERAASSVDEETQLMQDPLEEEILDAREEVAKPLREANEEGTLRRIK